MKILLLTHAYNCLCQRLHIELVQMGHEVSIEFDINDDITCDAVMRFQPELIIAPFLKRAIPDAIWQNTLCWIVHPGVIGDRGPSSLDWAIINQEETWGVTIIQANEVMDGGDIWASVEFPMRNTCKSSIYRQEVTQAAITGIKQALERHADEHFKPHPLSTLDSTAKGQWRGVLTQADRAIDWQQDGSEVVVRKIHSADGNPGLLAELFGQQVYLFNASIAHDLQGTPGEVIAQKNGAIAIATRDSAVWVSHLRKKPDDEKKLTLKLPAAEVLSGLLSEQLHTIQLTNTDSQDYNEIWHEREGDIVYLHFNFYNGAMSTVQCQQLLTAYIKLATSNVKAIVLMGGNDFWSNGIHLNVIEHHASPADESWHNINAMNDLCQAIIETTDKLTVAAINGNIGAGGVFLALACDLVTANDQVVFNPHYKSMGNLYGSEYWSYLLPRRVGHDMAQSITQNRLPIGALQANELGLIDGVFPKNEFFTQLTNKVQTALAEPYFSEIITDKKLNREQDETEKPLQQYREQELEKMKLNFYGFDPSYHVARYHFVYKLPKSRTPSYLARHRIAGYTIGEHTQGAAAIFDSARC
ncbi:MAG: hydrogenase maturation protein [Porticoccus sp.]|nr:hydrogenase maturation protein [Porticoccus sp.]